MHLACSTGRVLLIEAITADDAEAMLKAGEGLTEDSGPVFRPAPSGLWAPGAVGRGRT